MELRVSGEDLRHEETGGGYRSVVGCVTYDTSLPRERQLHSLFVEVLGCALDYVLSEDKLNDLADLLLDGYRQWVELCESERMRTE